MYRSSGVLPGQQAGNIGAPNFEVGAVTDPYRIHVGGRDTVYPISRDTGRDISFPVLSIATGVDSSCGDPLVLFGNDKEEEDGITLLMGAIESNDVFQIESLLQNDTFLEKKDKYGFTALMWAVGTGSLECCELLLKSGADVNTKDVDGTTPLMLAAQNGNLVLCKLLLKWRAYINAQDKSDYTAFTFAALGNHVDAFTFLFASGAGIYEDGDITLSCAIRNNLLGIVHSIRESSMLNYLLNMGK